MKQLPRTQFFLAWAIWTSFLAGLVLLMLLARFQQDRLGAILQPGISIVWFRTLGYVFAIIVFPIIGGIRRRLERKIAGGPVVAERSMEESPVPGLYLAGLILALALAESIGILGFVLFLFGDSLQTLYIFVGLSALGILLHRPRAEFSP